MANIKSSAKRARQNVNQRAFNRYYSTSARTYIKKARAQIAANELEDAEQAVQAAAKTLDKAAQKGIIHPNNAARRKSRLMKALNKARSSSD